MQVNEVELKSAKGVNPGDYIIYSFENFILFDKVEKVKENKLFTKSNIIDENNIKILCHSYSMNLLLDKIERIELLISDNILSFVVKGYQRKSEISYHLKSNNTVILNVSVK